MLTPAEAFPILADCIRHGRRHPDYERVCKLRELYYRLITGDGAEKLLQQFVRREDAEQFEQRVALTRLTVMAWSGIIMQQFYRPGRLRNVKTGISYANNQPNAAKKLAEINDRLSTYYGRESLDKWLATRFVALSFEDPNAFVVTEFAKFNPNKEKAKPYPVEYTANEAVLFSYSNNLLDYLIVKQTLNRVNAAGKLVAFDKYTMYLENDIVVAEQQLNEDGTKATVTGYDANNPSSQLPASGVWVKDSADSYAVSLYQPRGGKVQAVRPGYMTDPQTGNRTFVNPFHKAVPFFEKSIHENSQMDLSLANHAFPQKLMYAIPCPGVSIRKPCLAGVTGDSANGEPIKCARCLGLGVIVHKSATDVLMVPLPTNGAPAPAVPLKDMVVYVTPDIQLLEFLDNHLKSLRQDCIDAVFNSGVTSTQQAATADPAAKTATEVTISDDRADNTLAPFADQCAAVWRYKVELIAELLDNGGPDLQLVKEYPSSYRILKYEELIARRKAAVDAGSPHYVIQALDAQLDEMLFSTDDTALAKIKAKNFFTPFLGKSDDAVFTLISLGKVRQVDEILWTYVDSIFDELEEEVPEFYSYNRVKQWELIKEKADKIQSELPQTTTALQLPQLDTQPA